MLKYKCPKGQRRFKMRRKKAFTHYFESLDEAVNCIKKVKDIYGNQVEVEMYETNICDSTIHGWLVEVWKVH